MRFSRLTALLTASAMAVAPVAATAQSAQTPPQAASWDQPGGANPAATVIGVVLGVVLLAIAIQAIGRGEPRRVPPPVSP